MMKKVKKVRQQVCKNLQEDSSKTSIYNKTSLYNRHSRFYSQLPRKTIFRNFSPLLLVLSAQALEACGGSGTLKIVLEDNTGNNSLERLALIVAEPVSNSEGNQVVYVHTLSKIPGFQTFSLRQQGDAQYFIIDQTDGIISFDRSNLPSYETDTRYEIVIDAFENGAVVKTFEVVVNLRDVNEAPVFDASIPSVINFLENQLGSQILSAYDEDRGDIIQYYEFVESSTGDDNNLFNIDRASGTISFKVAPDFENPQSAGVSNDYVIEVKVVSAIGEREKEGTKQFVIRVGNQDEEPYFTTQPDRLTAFENRDLTPIYEAIAIDPDAPDGSGIIYSLEGDDTYFSIDTSIGELYFGEKTNGPTLNFENPFHAPDSSRTGNEYAIDIIATSTLLGRVQSVRQTVVVFLQDVPEAFEFESSATIPVNENSPKIAVYESTSTLVVDEQNIAPGLSIEDVRYSIEAGGDDVYFSVDAETGIVSFGVAGGQLNRPDFENPVHRLEYIGNENTYTVTLIARLGQYEARTPITVEVQDVNEPVYFTSAENLKSGLFDFTENRPHEYIDTVETEDPDDDAVEYSIFGDTGFFSIVADTGVLYFGQKPNGPRLDFENPVHIPDSSRTDNEYTITIVAFDPDGSEQRVSKTVTVRVTDVDEDPYFVTQPDDDIRVFENAEPVVIYTVQAEDPESDPIGYRIYGDTRFFSLDQTNGQITFGVDGQGNRPDFENPLDVNADNTYIVTIEISSQGRTAVQTLVVEVQDLLEQASFTTTPSDNIVFQENDDPAPVYTASAQSQSGTVSYSIIGDTRYFAIDSSSGVGVLTFGVDQAGDKPDFEDPDYSSTINGAVIVEHVVTVIASFSPFDWAQQQVRVTLQDQNERPVLLNGTVNLGQLAADSLSPLITKERLLGAFNDPDNNPDYGIKKIIFTDIPEEKINGISYTRSNGSTVSILEGTEYDIADIAAGIIIDIKSIAIGLSADALIEYTVADSVGRAQNGDTASIFFTIDDQTDLAPVFTIEALPGVPLIQSNVNRIRLTAGSYDEKEIAIVNARDPDPVGNAIDYQLAGTSISYFSRRADDGKLLFTGSASYNPNTPNIYEVTITATERGGTTSSSALFEIEIVGHGSGTGPYIGTSFRDTIDTLTDDDAIIMARQSGDVVTSHGGDDNIVIVGRVANSQFSASDYIMRGEAASNLLSFSTLVQAGQSAGQNDLDLTDVLQVVDRFIGPAVRYEQDLPISGSFNEIIQTGGGNDRIISYGISDFQLTTIENAEQLYIDGLAKITAQQLNSFENIVGNGISSKIVVTQEVDLSDLSYIQGINFIQFAAGSNWVLPATLPENAMPQSASTVYLKGLESVTVHDMSHLNLLSNIAFSSATRFLLAAGQDVTDITNMIKYAQPDQQGQIYQIKTYDIMRLDESSGILVLAEKDYIEYTDLVKAISSPTDVTVTDFHIIGNDKIIQTDSIEFYNAFNAVNDNVRFYFTPIVENNKQFFRLITRDFTLGDQLNLNIGDNLLVNLKASDKHGYGVLASFFSSYILDVIDTNDNPPLDIDIAGAQENINITLEFDYISPSQSQQVENNFVIGQINISDLDSAQTNDYDIEFTLNGFIDSSGTLRPELLSQLEFFINDDNEIILRDTSHIVSGDKISLTVRVTDRIVIDGEVSAIVGSTEKDFQINFTVGTPALGVVIVPNGDLQADFTLMLDQRYDHEIIVDYYTSSELAGPEFIGTSFGGGGNFDNYLSARAEAGIDYISRRGSVIFEPYEVAKTVSVDIIDRDYSDTGIFQLIAEVRRPPLSAGEYDSSEDITIYTEKAAIIFGRGTYIGKAPLQSEFHNDQSLVYIGDVGDRSGPDGNSLGSFIIDGGPGDDVFTGYSPSSRQKDYIDGGDGDDTISAGEGHDYLLGGDGDDIIDVAAGGSDYVSGGKGADIITLGTSSQSRGDSDAIYLSLADIDADNHRPDIIKNFDWLTLRYSSSIGLVSGDYFIVDDMMLRNGNLKKVDLLAYESTSRVADRRYDVEGADVIVFDQGAENFENAEQAYTAFINELPQIERPDKFAARLFLWENKEADTVISYLIDPALQDISEIYFYDLAILEDRPIDRFVRNANFYDFALNSLQFVIDRSDHLKTISEHQNRLVRGDIEDIIAIKANANSANPDNWRTFKTPLENEENGSKYFNYTFARTSPGAPLHSSARSITDEDHKTIIRQILSEFTHVTGVNFFEDNPIAGNNQSELLHFNFYPTSAGTAAFTNEDIGIYLSTGLYQNQENWSFHHGNNSQAGSVYYTLLHEFGHYYGLDHPMGYFRYEDQDTVTARLPHYSLFDDHPGNTLLTYDGNYSKADPGSDTRIMSNSTFGLYDILLFQKEYGANEQANAQDTVYGFNYSVGIGHRVSPSLQAISTDLNRAISGTIWDSAGIDTIDLSLYTMDQIVTLIEGEFSSVAGLKRNLAIAFGTEIENVKTGAGDDDITGNRLDNEIRAGAGNDSIFSPGGRNTIYGGAGNDIFIFGDINSRIDTVKDYNQGDKFDFTKLLLNSVSLLSDNYTDYVSAVFNADSTILTFSLDSDGTGTETAAEGVVYVEAADNTILADVIDINSFFDLLIT